MTTTADIARGLVELDDIFTRPLEDGPAPKVFGRPLRHPCLAHYPAVTPENANAALYLLKCYFFTELRAFERRYALFPTEVRRRIEMQVVLIKLKRALVKLEVELNRLMEENRMANFPCQKCGAVERTTDRYPTLPKRPCPQCGEETEREASEPGEKPAEQ